MIVLFEGYHYPTAALAAVLPDHYARPLTNGRAKPVYVGYLAPDPAAAGGHAVLLLPKVFVDEDNQALGDLNPDDLLTLPDRPALREQLRRDGWLAFVFQLAVWLHRAIGQFAQRHRDSELPEQSGLQATVGVGGQGRSALELIQALLDFQREHPHLFVTVRQPRARQARTVSWPRTVSRQVPLLTSTGRPLYAELAGRHPHRALDEELLRLFSGTLHYLRREFGFRLDLSALPDPPPATEWRPFRAAPLRRLRELRGRYFNDRLVRLWELLYRYYDQTERQRTNRSRRERLLIRDFNLVFEDMVDYLLSDPSGTYPPTLREQRDGKRMDHLYEDAAVVSGPPDTIYFIRLV